MRRPGANAPTMTPVFILGPGRSGTTLLYKLVAAMPDVAYLSNYNHRYPGAPWSAVLARTLTSAYGVKRRTWFQGEGAANLSRGRPWYQQLVPKPVEGEAVYQACGVPELEGLDRPLAAAAATLLRQRFAAICAAAGQQVLVSKRTANNRRVPQLLQAFPDARFICLLRDGRAVARSLVRVRWWADHTLFWCGRTPRELVGEGEDDLALAARNWVEEMAVMEDGMRLIASSRLLLLHYDDLLARPQASLKRVHDFMHPGSGLPAAYWAFIASMALEPTAADWLERLPAGERERIETVQQPTLERWRFGVGSAGPIWPSTGLHATSAAG